MVFSENSKEFEDDLLVEFIFTFSGYNRVVIHIILKVTASGKSLLLRHT